jgi:HK97 family phage prohead protease
MVLKTLSVGNADFKVKALEDGSVYLEGWANKAIVDRGKDLIGKKAWNLDNYKKNSIMLFNHDHSKPIGKMISVEAKDEGLYIKGRISNSKDPEISRIRDLVKEGILNSLSVGIMVSDEEQKDGVNVIKSVELHEVSVVSVPMNQDSQFTVSAKSIGGGSILDAIEIIVAESGHKDVEKACKKLHADDTVYDSVDQIAEKIAVECSIEKQKALDFIRMRTTETPIQIKDWIEKNMAEQEEVKAEEEGADVQLVSVPKEAVASMEELQAWAEASGWKTDAIEETEDAYLLVQIPADQFEGDLRSIDMGDGVSALVGKLKKEDAAAEEEVIEPVEEDKALANDPMTQPAPKMDQSQIEINPSLDQAKQTNVLLANMVSLLQQISEKMDRSQEVPEAGPEIEVEVEAPEEEKPSEEDAQLAKKIESFIMKTNDRLSQLGL